MCGAVLTFWLLSTDSGQQQCLYVAVRTSNTAGHEVELTIRGVVSVAVEVAEGAGTLFLVHICGIHVGIKG